MENFKKINLEFSSKLLNENKDIGSYKGPLTIFEHCNKSLNDIEYS